MCRSIDVSPGAGDEHLILNVQFLRMAFQFHGGDAWLRGWGFGVCGGSGGAKGGGSVGVGVGGGGGGGGGS